jgi:hypothetical protein
LVKLGITVPERTVSRYLCDRLRAPSQRWRTFFANHLGALTFSSIVTSSDAPGDDDVINVGVFPLRSAPALGDGPSYPKLCRKTLGLEPTEEVSSSGQEERRSMAYG